MVSFNNFRMLDPETADLARELIENADRQRSAFMSFVNVWMAFNGWMESVTDSQSDAAMIAALAENPRLAGAYEHLLQTSRPFSRRVASFSNMWPVLNVRDVRRKLGRDACWLHSREELLQRCLDQQVKLQPVGWVEAPCQAGRRSLGQSTWSAATCSTDQSLAESS